MPNSLELNVSPAQLHTFANHPFHVRKDMEMNELVDSIRESGVIVPLIVRSRPEGGYEIISGHRRCEACQELNANPRNGDYNADIATGDKGGTKLVTSGGVETTVTIYDSPKDASEIPSVLSGINRIQRWSQSKPQYIDFHASSRHIYGILSPNWSALSVIRNKHPLSPLWAHGNHFPPAPVRP